MIHEGVDTFFTDCTLSYCRTLYH